MNGAQSLVRTLLAAGVDTCYANPGTSEMHFVAALDTTPGMRCVLGLQENVVTGMADGHFRMSGQPACTLLHCGPGLANGWANLHNARRACWCAPRRTRRGPGLGWRRARARHAGGARGRGRPPGCRCRGPR
ncbi:MAG: thiamine pyrophosphate-binding protein, partial [Rubrivivax sp.]